MCVSDPQTRRRVLDVSVEEEETLRFWQGLGYTPLEELEPLASHAEALGFFGVTLGDHWVTAEEQVDRYESAKDGELPWDTFYGNTKKEVVMQLDVGNAIGGGVDPLPYLYKYPDRAITVHVKEYCEADPDALVGDGDVNWKAFFALCRAVGSTEWFIVEYERKGAPPLECVEKCLKNLRRLRLV